MYVFYISVPRDHRIKKKTQTNKFGNLHASNMAHGSIAAASETVNKVDIDRWNHPSCIAAAGVYWEVPLLPQL